MATPCGLLKTDGDLTTEIGAAVTAAGSLEAGRKEGTRPNKRSPFMGLLRWTDGVTAERNLAREADGGRAIDSQCVDYYLTWGSP